MATSVPRPSSADCELKKERIGVLEEHERMLLVGADRDALLTAMMETTEPTEKLVTALKRRREIVG